MEIKSIDDIKTVVSEMHDSEFNAEDFGFNADKKAFYLKSHSSGNASKELHLQFYNVEKYEPVNLDKINMRKGTAGVFDDIRVRDKGFVLEILSQDLRILLRLSKLDGKLEISNIK